MRRVATMFDAVVRFCLSGIWGAAVIGLPLAAYFSSLEGWPPWTGLPAPLFLAPRLYPLQIAATLGVLFLSYRYLVRPTFIGATLNGRRYPRSGGAAMMSCTAWPVVILVPGPFLVQSPASMPADAPRANDQCRSKHLGRSAQGQYRIETCRARAITGPREAI